MPECSAWTCLLLPSATSFARALTVYVVLATGSPAWPGLDEGALGPLVSAVASLVPAVDRVADRVLELGFPERAGVVRHLRGVSWAIAGFWACLSVPAHLTFRPRRIPPDERERPEADAWTNATTLDQGQPAWRRGAWGTPGAALPASRGFRMALLAIGLGCFACRVLGDVIARQDGEADLEPLPMPQAMGSGLFAPALLAPLAFSCTIGGFGLLRRPRPGPAEAAGPGSG